MMIDMKDCLDRLEALQVMLKQIAAKERTNPFLLEKDRRCSSIYAILGEATVSIDRAGRNGN